MKFVFLLDENFPAAARPYLEADGHLVQDIRGTSREGCDDMVLFALAQENRATILTTDKDFFHTVPFAFPEHCGVVVVTLKKPSSKAILQRLQESWDSLTRTGFKNQAFLLTDSRIYARRK
jgi:predicted nuclease of predicted toxin-antitoxin system